jgi:carotenoid cleavage dioxygenase
MIKFNLKELKQGFVLPWGSVLVFAFFAIHPLTQRWPWATEHVFLLSNSALAAIVIFSMLIGKPFTVQYAREQVAYQHWHKPLFMKINWILTSIWAILMIVMAIPSFIFPQSYIQSSWCYNYGLAIICILVGIRCNKAIPAWLRKHQ